MFLKFKITTILILFSLITCLQSQELTYQNTSDTLHNKNMINVGVNRVVNTFTFNGDADIEQDILFGKIKLFQQYRSTSIMSASDALRDDESFSFEYSYPFSKNYWLVVEQNWLLSADTRSIGVNKLERLNGTAGLKYNFQEGSFFQALAGVERNNQVGIVTYCPKFNIMGTISNFQLEDFDINADIHGEYLDLGKSRANSDLDINSNAILNYDKDNKFNLSLNYKLLNRDYLNPIAEFTEGGIPDEMRLENRLRGDLNVDFSITRFLFGTCNLSFNSINVSRSYKKKIPDEYFYGGNLNPTGIERMLNELQLSFSADVKYILQGFSQNFGLTYYTRNEENQVQKKFDIKQDEENAWRSQEKLRDNITAKTRFFSKTDWQPFRSDTVRLEYSVSLFQYDTPSPLNYDDRDEFSSIINLYLSHRFSHFLSGALTTEARLTHFVFLKAERSAMNNWNRVFRLKPEIVFKNKFVYVNPQLEVLANYTVYDYEYMAPGVKSFSYRQISYKDSLCILMGKLFSLQLNIKLRYYERGILFWKSFSEAPQSSNFEHFTKAIFNVKPSNIVSFGCGVGYYNLKQKNLAAIGGLYNSDYSQVSTGPVAVIKVEFPSGSSISLEGWYEIQRINSYNLASKPLSNIFYVPNLFISTKMKL